jgi:hypothetical protein
LLSGDQNVVDRAYWSKNGSTEIKLSVGTKVASVCGRAGFGWLSDMFSKKALFVIFFMLQFVGILILVVIVYAFNSFRRRPGPSRLTEVLKSKTVPVKSMAKATSEAKVNLAEAEKVVKKKGIEQLSDPFSNT